MINENIFLKRDSHILSLININEIPEVIPSPRGIRPDILEIALIEEKPGNT
tara:strand:- start:115 stop:267 length:153 start_codon:yes stop_codon:yes gene_type:complete